MKIMPIGLGKDGNYRVQVTEQNIKNGIVFGEKSGFAKAVNAEGYAALQDGLNKGSLLPVFGASAGNGLFVVDVVEASATE